LKAIDNACASVAAQAFSDELVVFKFREVLLPGIAFTALPDFVGRLLHVVSGITK
jgi:hypothetical protein